MTGYQSKKSAASAKTIDEVNWADHETNGRRAAARDKLETWVGLTTVDRKEIERQSVYVEGAIRMTEAKLKEKNNG